MRLYCTRLTPKLTNNWKLLLLVFLAALTLTIIFFRTSFIARRPKTLLIYNNKYLCSSNTPRANSHNHWSITVSGSENTQTSIVIVVPSCRKNFLKRNLIRQTYGSIKNINNVHILAVVFILGGADAPDAAKTDIGKLDAERVQFGDVIMGDLVDTYRNLSRKSIMAYNWLTSFCHEADLVVKTDDDVLVDIFKLTDELGKWTSTVFKSFYFWCAVHWTEAIDRDEQSIYYVSFEEYAGREMPKHCAGVGYVTPMVMIHRIADEISKSFLGPICTHEDVFMTGIVPERINSAENEPIEYIDKMRDWVLYVDEYNPNKDGAYIWNVTEPSANETVDFDEFRKRSGTRVFYLLQQNEDFERKYMRLWYLVKNSFQNERMANKIDIN